MSSIDSRLSAITEAIRRCKMEQEAPLDDLSRSLFEFGRELAELDERSKAELLEKLNQPGEDGTMGLDVDMEALEQMIKGAKT